MKAETSPKMISFENEKFVLASYLEQGVSQILLENLGTIILALVAFSLLGILITILKKLIARFKK